MVDPTRLIQFDQVSNPIESTDERAPMINRIPDFAGEVGQIQIEDHLVSAKLGADAIVRHYRKSATKQDESGQVFYDSAIFHSYISLWHLRQKRYPSMMKDRGGGGPLCANADYFISRICLAMIIRFFCPAK